MFEPVKITLTEGMVFWNVQGLVLNMNNPGPVEIDFWSLPEAQQTIIRAGKNNGKIQVEGNITEKPNVQPLFADQSADLKFFEHSQLLAKGVHKIREEIRDMIDVGFLNKCLALETEGKNRKSLVSILEKKITSILAHSEDDTVQANYDSMVEETEVKEVKFATKSALLLESEESIIEDLSNGGGTN